MAKYKYYTQAGLEKLTKELRQLETTGRRTIAQQIGEAREKGDLRENAEYEAAKDAQAHLELKISKLKQLVSQARVIDKSKLDPSKVSIFSKVKLKNLKTQAILTYTLVAGEEADLKQAKISVESPIGKGLLGKKKGDIAEIQVPRGLLNLEILDTEIDLE